MTRFNLRFGVTLVCALLGLAAPARAGERPFYAEGEAIRVSSGHTERYFGDTEVMHFGLARLVFEARSSALYPPEEGVDPRVVVTSAFLLAANGDQLFLDVDVELDPDTGIAVGTLTFAGGTGRFADAAGTADVLLLFGDRYRSFDFLIAGTIDY